MKKIILITSILLISLSSFSQIPILKSNVMSIFISDWIGVRYKMGGQTKRGVDCSAFSKTLYKTVYNIDIPRTARLQYGYLNKVSKDSLEEGNLVFFRNISVGTGWHVGIYLKDGYFVHASGKGSGVKISNLDETYYTKYYLSGGSLSDEEIEFESLNINTK